MKPRLAMACIVALVTMATACGGSGEGAPDTTRSDATQETDGGGDPGGSGLPESVSAEFAVAIPDGWEIDLLGEIGMSNTSGVQLLYPAESFSSIVSFYDDWTETQDDEYSRTEEGDLVVFTGAAMYISITRDHEERDLTWTLVQVSTGG